MLWSTGSLRYVLSNALTITDCEATAAEEFFFRCRAAHTSRESRNRARFNGRKQSTCETHLSQSPFHVDVISSFTD
jgi:hypothetical protein